MDEALLYQWALEAGLIDRDLSSPDRWVPDLGEAKDAVKAFAEKVAAHHRKVKVSFTFGSVGPGVQWTPNPHLLMSSRVQWRSNLENGAFDRPPFNGIPPQPE